MKPLFIELTITSDSSDALASPRKGMICHDQITAVTDSAVPFLTKPTQTEGGAND